MSLRALHGLTSVVYDLNETFLLSSEVINDTWRLTLSVTPAPTAAAWWQTSISLARAEGLLAKVDKPSGAKTVADAVLRHYTEGGIDVSEAANGKRQVGFGASSLKILLESMREAPVEALVRIHWESLLQCAMAKTDLDKQLRALQSIADPARVDRLTTENKNLARRVESLEEENKTLKRYASTSGKSSGVVKKAGPPPAKRHKGPINLMQPGKPLSAPKEQEFMSSESEKEEQEPKQKTDKPKDSDTESEA